MKRPILALAILLAALPAPSKISPDQTASPMQMVSAVTDDELRAIVATTNLPGEKISVKEEKDAEGLTAYYVYEGESILLALYQYTDKPGGPTTSLGLSVGNRLARAADIRKINDWNAKTRYVKAYVDSEGDAMLTSDLLLSPGVTKLTIQEWIKMFARFSHEFTDYLKP
ncbi:MAG: YbjN domain-containing protein [Armatimonadetes bacterium]|nr:YbjN domain-containing protein [Armatimonadota bacterium]MBS1711048.1 YbjN domain-containing protein [Armatimonadota bacterium]MBX3108720.1 YbjN domain-containing protein [Fimbriimonadaceae bacterium]